MEASVAECERRVDVDAGREGPAHGKSVAAGIPAGVLEAPVARPRFPS